MSQPSYRAWECYFHDTSPCVEFRVDEWTDGYLTAFANVRLGCDAKTVDDLIAATMRRFVSALPTSE